MMRTHYLFLSLFIWLMGACSRPDVVIYCAADQDFAQPILKELGAKLGMDVRTVFDAEAAKTVGLVRTLLEEKTRPRCDVFWNNEIVHTLRLKEAGVLASYASPSAANIPTEYKDPAGYWTGFAARARVIIINTDLVKSDARPNSVRDLANPIWKAKCGFPRPLAGTGLTHFASLISLWGNDAALQFFDGVLANNVNLASGNGPVAKLVGAGELAWGIVDTDDYEVQRRNGKPVDAIYPDQDAEGTIVLPNTIALVAGSPNPENGKKLIDALLDTDIERRLAESASANIPVRAGVPVPKNVKKLGEFRSANVNFDAVAKSYDANLEILKKRFLR
ncbi:MAG: extracellular solute-binding protein [Planctomycetota bacterium]